MVHGEFIHPVGWAGDGMVRCGSRSPANYRVNTYQADLASAMPTAGGLYFWTHHFAERKWKNPLSFLIGYTNTLGLIGGMCSVDCEDDHCMYKMLSIILLTLGMMQIHSPS
jgi:hypothetical protein